MSRVAVRGVSIEIEEAPYWHLVDAADLHGQVLFHNARLGEGICPSASAVAATPGLESVGTRYAAFHKDREKEAIFERVRCNEFPGRPSRYKAFFLFDSLEFAQEAQRRWFQAEGRVLVDARIVRGSNAHRTDSRWLDARAKDWEANARRYWMGEMSANPWPEVIVDGAVYFPAWRTFDLLRPNRD